MNNEKISELVTKNNLKPSNSNQKRNNTVKQLRIRSISPLIFKIQSPTNYPEGKNEKYYQEKIALLKSSSPIIDLNLNETQNSISNSVANFLIHCSCCNSLESVKGFICNHNLCMKCLVFTGIKQINDFFNLYKDERIVVAFRFLFICPYKDCCKEINIPCNLIVNRIYRYIENREERFAEFYHVRSWGLEFWDQWIPYFDGIGLS